MKGIYRESVSNDLLPIIDSVDCAAFQVCFCSTCLRRCSLDEARILKKAQSTFESNSNRPISHRSRP